MAKLLRDIFGDTLVLKPLSGDGETVLPSPAALMGKVLIKVRFLECDATKAL